MWSLCRSPCFSSSATPNNEDSLNELCFLLIFIFPADIGPWTNHCLCKVQSADVTDLSPCLTNTPEVTSNLGDINSDFQVFYPKQCPNPASMDSLSYPSQKCYFFPFYIYIFFFSLPAWSKQRVLLKVRVLIGFHPRGSFPSCDRCRGPVGWCTRGNQRTLGWVMLKSLNYWVISPFSLPEHKNKEHLQKKREHRKDLRVWGLTMRHLRSP